MKKTISLIFVLIMVFALASSASAITGLNSFSSIVTAIPPYTDINMLVVESPSTNLGMLTIQPVPDNKTFVKGSTMNFALCFKTPNKDLITMANYDYIAPWVLLSSDVVEFDRLSIRVFTITDNSSTSGTTLTFYEEDNRGNEIRSRLFARLPDPTIVGDRTYVITGSAVVVGNANGIIRAEFQGARGCTKFLPLPTTPKEVHDSLDYGLGEIGGGHLVNRDKTLLYSIAATGTAAANQKITYTVRLQSGTYAGAKVIFTTDYNKSIVPASKNNLDKIEIQLPQRFMYPGEPMHTFRVNDTGTQLHFSYPDGSMISTGLRYNALRAIYDNVMNFFELNIGKDGILLPQHFAYKFSTFYATDSDNVNVRIVPATVSNEGVDFPHTGDTAATSMYLLIMALAIVVAFGLVYKKFHA
ncbi:MAG: hypothetical protein GYA87_08685 [Christensenellaceae bacterium]|nr:hypothetical protein [Christensenellaceae bacterium]